MKVILGMLLITWPFIAMLGMLLYLAIAANGWLNTLVSVGVTLIIIASVCLGVYLLTN